MSRSSAIILHQALAAAAILIPAAAFLAAAIENRNDVIREGEGTILRTVAVLDGHARRVFETVDLMLGRVDDRVKNLPGHEIDLPRMNEFLSDMSEPLPQAVSIWVSDRSGIILAGSQEWNRATNIRDREFFSAHQKGSRETHISAPFIGRATNTASFAMSRARTGVSGEFNGVLHVALSPDYFSSFFSEASTGGKHSAVLFRGDGTVLARDPAGGQARIAADSDFMKAVAASPDAGMFRGASPFDGLQGVYAYRRAAPFNVYVTFGQSNEALVARWYKNIQLYGAVAASAAMFLLILSLLALRRVHAEQEALRQLNIQSEQRLAAEQRLFQSQKMESLGQLTGGIAHDFNNLLAVILGNLGLMGKHVRGNERAERLLERAMQGAERGATLTQRLLAFARRQELAPQSVDVGILVHGVLDLLRSTIGGGVEVVAEIEPDVGPALVDPNQLELAILNLTVNARDAMPEGGRIILSTASTHLGEDNDLSLPPGDYICLAITDNGDGMDAATLARASEPFFTTKDVGKGTGLGLSIVHGLAIQSGGAFRLASTQGSGTRAEIWLPRCIGRAVEVAPVPTAQAEMPVEGRILLVDDDMLVRNATRAMLEDAGYDVIEAGSAAAALDLLQTETVDLLITDLVMPGVSGAVLATRTGELKPDLPILIISGHGERAGNVPPELPRLAKPFSPADLHKLVGRLLKARLSA